MKCIFHHPGKKCRFTSHEVDCFFTPEYEQDCEDAQFIEGPHTAQEIYLKAQELKNHNSILNDSVR